MRVIVTGSRRTTTMQRLFVLQTLTRVLGPIAIEGGGVIIVEGERPDGGVDRDARDWAIATPGADYLGYPARWIESGRSAGPKRNLEMVSDGADLCIAFPALDSKGTWDCLIKAAAAGIPGRVYPLPR